MLKSAANTYRSAYSGLSRATWLLSFIMLINRSGTMVIPFMTLYLTSEEMGYSVAQAGIVFGLFGLGAFFGAYAGGKLTDKIGFYKVQLLALAGGGLLFMVLGQLRSYELICLFTFLLSFVNEAFRPANSAAIAFYSKKENRTRSYSLNRLAINLGWAAGSAVGGILADISYELLFWVDGFTNLGAAVLMWLLLRQAATSPAKQAEETTQAPVLSAYKDRQYLLFIIFVTLFACCFFQLFTNVPVFLKKNLHYTETYIGSLMALNGLIIVLVEMVLIYKLENKGRDMAYIVAGTLLMGAAYLYLLTPYYSLLTGIVLILFITFGEILAMPFMNSYWIQRAHPANRGQYAALYTMAWSVAQTLGPMSGAQLAERYGFRMLWLVIGLLGIVTAAAIWYFLVRKRKDLLPAVASTNTH